MQINNTPAFGNIHSGIVIMESFSFVLRFYGGGHRVGQGENGGVAERKWGRRRGKVREGSLK